MEPPDFDGREPQVTCAGGHLNLEGTVPCLSLIQPAFLVGVEVNPNGRSHLGDSVRFTRHAASGMLTRLR
jgi:hypothetical protein